MSGPFRFDLHVHSGRSPDAKGSLMELAIAARDAGLHGFAVTDHNAVWSEPELVDAMDATGLFIVPGCEISTLQGHVLAFGVTQTLPKGASVPRSVAAVRDQGGVCVPAHPLKVLSGLGPHALREHVEAGRFPAIEARNGRERALVHENTLRLAADLGVGTTGGTDAHWVKDIGTAWTEFPKAVHSLDGFLKQLEKGRTQAAGGRLPRRKVVGHGLTVPWRTLQAKRSARNEGKKEGEGTEASSR